MLRVAETEEHSYDTLQELIQHVTLHCDVITASIAAAAATANDYMTSLLCCLL
jgi:hypothetical protein